MSGRRRWRILYVAYPMFPVTRESCGGAEQMLWVLEAEMARRGHETMVAACDGSQIAGRLFATGAAPQLLDCFEARDAEHAARIVRLLADTQPEPIDLVHDESGSFWRHSAAVPVPVLATLHLPRSFYPAGAFDRLPRHLFFNCVSHSQRRTFADLPRLLGVVRNGVRVEQFPRPRSRRDDYLLWIGRICEEKGAHVAIEVAGRAGRKLILAGGVYPFSYHQTYFEREVRPHVDGSSVCHAGVPRFTEKLHLLGRAHALLLPSLADETSSLVAMEAMACGTPVIALRRGAIPEIVRHGVTGFVVDSVEEMVEAVERAADIDPQACRAHVEANFNAARMADEYERIYQLAAETAKAQRSSTAA